MCAGQLWRRAEHSGTRSLRARCQLLPGHQGTAGWRPLLAVIPPLPGSAHPRLQSVPLFGVLMWHLFTHVYQNYHFPLISTLN